MPQARTLPLMFMDVVRRLPAAIAQLSKDEKGIFQPTSYAELLEGVRIFASGLLELGVTRGDKVGLIADNRKEWLVSDLAILGLGAADVPRGCDATDQEIAYILEWSECRIAILENAKQLKKIVDRRASMPGLTTVVLFDPAGEDERNTAGKAGLVVRSYAEIYASGSKRMAEKPGEYEAEAEKGQRTDLATLIYTSGTTGDPKGVMLSHGVMLQQAEYLPGLIGVTTGHIFLAVLPVWHSYERAVQYILLAVGASIAYSKPVGSIMLADMQTIHPQWLASVPRIWESIKDGVYRNIKQSGGAKKVIFGFFVGVGESFAYFRNLLFGRIPAFIPRPRIVDIGIAFLPFLLLLPLKLLGNLLVFGKIKAKLGGKFIAGISGGGALPPSVDRFFDAIGILVLEGYGLTETGPVIGVRETRHPVAGTVGRIVRDMEIRIVGEKGETLGAGGKGIIMVRGPQVMTGYFKRPDLTAKVLSADGWLDTGDLGMLSVDGEIKITGRAKDTIVLRGGENLEPVPIEQKLCESEYILQSIVLGQDQKFLVALIVPRQEAIVAWANDNNIPGDSFETLLQQPEVQELLDSEVKELVSPRNGFKSFERLFRFKLLANPFEVGRELSAKQEIKRHTVNEIYRREIRALFED